MIPAGVLVKVMIDRGPLGEIGQPAGETSGVASQVFMVKPQGVEREHGRGLRSGF